MMSQWTIKLGGLFVFASAVNRAVLFCRKFEAKEDEERKKVSDELEVTLVHLKSEFVIALTSCICTLNTLCSGGRKASLLKAMCKTFGPYFLLGTFLKIIQDMLAFISPILLK